MDDPEPEPLSFRQWITSKFKPEEGTGTLITSSYSGIKPIISIAQLVYAITTLYHTRGDQIAIFGYAAFGLTVTQYAWMSLINLLGNWACPQYPSLYLVESSALRDLRAAPAHQFRIQGTAGMVSESTEEIVQEHFDSRRTLFENGRPAAYLFYPFSVVKITTFALVVVLAAMPLVVIGALSRFSPGSSTLPQRVWTMTWLVFGFTIGPSVESAVDTVLQQRSRISRFGRSRQSSIFGIFYLADLLGIIVGIGAYAAPAIGGFVVVGQMFYQYGVCFEI
jgi:hypothetical protein